MEYINLKQALHILDVVMSDDSIKHKGKAYPKTQQVAKCGNAVTPPVATALVRANLPEYCKEVK